MADQKIGLTVFLIKPSHAQALETALLGPGAGSIPLAPPLNGARYGGGHSRLLELSVESLLKIRHPCPDFNDFALGFWLLHAVASDLLDTSESKLRQIYPSAFGHGLALKAETLRSRMTKTSLNLVAFEQACAASTSSTLSNSGVDVARQRQLSTQC